MPHPLLHDDYGKFLKNHAPLENTGIGALSL